MANRSAKVKKYTVILTDDKGREYPFRVSGKDEKAALHIAARRVASYLRIGHDDWIQWIGWARCPHKVGHGYIIAKREPTDKCRPYSISKRWAYEVVYGHSLIVYQLPLEFR